LTAFSHLSALTVDEVVVDDGVMTFSARTATRRAVCPGCGTVSGRVHGGYRRRLADVAVSGHRTVYGPPLILIFDLVFWLGFVVWSGVFGGVVGRSVTP